MSAIAQLELSLVLKGTEGTTQLAYEPAPFRFAPTVGKREDVSLTGSAFVALSPPVGSKMVAIVLPATAVSLTIKGVTGDGTGIAITPASNFLGLPILLPLGASPSIGILNGSATAVVATLIWL